MPDLFFLHDDVVQHFLLVDKTGLQVEQRLNQQISSWYIKRILATKK